MMAHRSMALACLALLSGCALSGAYDFDDYTAAPVGVAGAGGGVSGNSGTTQAGKAGSAGSAGSSATGGTAAGAGQGGAGQAGDAGAGGTTQGGSAGGGGEAGTSAGGSAGAAGQGGIAGAAGQGGAQGGTTQGGQAGLAGAGQAGAGAGQAGAGQAGAGQAGAGQAGAGQGGAGTAGAGGCAQPTTWYRDGDFDGHGTPLLSSMVACTKPADEPGVFQWVAAADDCNDANKDVFPGQTAYFGTPYAKPGAPADLSFDYDCDGTETPTAQTFAPACGGLSIGSCSGTGYVPYTPARTGTGIGAYCGSTHTISCVKQTIFCVDGAKASAGALACR